VTGQVLNDPELLNVCAGAFLGDDLYGALVVPLTYGYAGSALRIPVYDSLAKQHDKIVCVAWQSEWLEGPGVTEAEQSERVALFRSMPACFAALQAWNWRAAKRAAASAVVAETPADVRAEARAMIDAAHGRTLTEREAKALLMLYGVPVVGETLALTREEAAIAADGFEYPVVLKLESPDVPHKTEAGVIRLDLPDAGAVRAAFDEIVATAAALEPKPRINGVLVQKGIEIVVGGRVDPLFGPLVVVGLGGILVELLQDTALAPAPVTPAEALALLAWLKGARLLDGFRGMPAVDRAALAAVVSDVSRVLADHRGALAELDVNPLICAGKRIVAVDALIVPAARAAS
jgi:acetate---CoA ligase (ADP-forming)